LGSLQDNGGQTPTITFANPALIDRGSSSSSDCSGVDQRGLPRPIIFSTGAPGGHCDIGAIELQGPVGIAILDPDNATLKKQEKFHLNYLWRVPPGENWHDLKSLDLRVRDDDDTLIWFRWTEGADTFQLINPHTGEPHGPAVFAGSTNVLKTDDAELDAKESSRHGSRPTGPEVTLQLALTFHEKSGKHDAFTIEVNAANDKGQTQSFVALGSVTVR
jgi:hypothetical protein